MIIGDPYQCNIVCIRLLSILGVPGKRTLVVIVFEWKGDAEGVFGDLPVSLEVEYELDLIAEGLQGGLVEVVPCR